jgi:hypothetical protein
VYGAVGDAIGAAEVELGGCSVQVVVASFAGAAYAPSRGRAEMRNAENCIVRCRIEKGKKM